MANKALWRYIQNNKRKYKIKKHTLYILKRNIKNQTKRKKDVDKANKVCYYLIVIRRKNEN